MDRGSHRPVRLNVATIAARSDQLANRRQQDFNHGLQPLLNMRRTCVKSLDISVDHINRKITQSAAVRVFNEQKKSEKNRTDNYRWAEGWEAYNYNKNM